mmetsp:Transcript_19458/g.46440  ORF Transcript_19458/g.46440 Transcript_19458/m.46440 type:complete len:642 (-) Transcript_19458:267-2192(-)
MRRELQKALDLGWLTDHGQQVALLPEGRRHLVHDPARGSHHLVLGRLAEDRKLAPLHLDAVEPAQRHHGRDLERRRRADALAVGHLALDEDAEAPGALRLDALLGHQHQQATHHVRGPRLRRDLPEALARLLVGQWRAVGSLEVREEHVKGRGSVDVVGVERHDAEGGAAPAAGGLHVPPEALPADRLELRGDVAGGGGRHLQHVAARVVRDAAHHVEAPRGAGDDDLGAAQEKALRGSELVGVAALPLRDVGEELQEAPGVVAGRDAFDSVTALKVALPPHAPPLVGRGSPLPCRPAASRVPLGHVDRLPARRGPHEVTPDHRVHQVGVLLRLSFPLLLLPRDRLKQARHNLGSVGGLRVARLEGEGAVQVSPPVPREEGAPVHLDRRSMDLEQLPQERLLVEVVAPHKDERLPVGEALADGAVPDLPHDAVGRVHEVGDVGIGGRQEEVVGEADGVPEGGAAHDARPPVGEVAALEPPVRAAGLPAEHEHHHARPRPQPKLRADLGGSPPRPADHERDVNHLPEGRHRAVAREPQQAGGLVVVLRDLPDHFLVPARAQQVLRVDKVPTEVADADTRYSSSSSGCAGHRYDVRDDDICSSRLQPCYFCLQQLLAVEASDVFVFLEGSFHINSQSISLVRS